MKSKAEGFVFLVLDSSSSVPWFSSFFSIYFEEDQKFWNRSMTFAGFDIEPQATSQIHKKPLGIFPFRIRCDQMPHRQWWRRLMVQVEDSCIPLEADGAAQADTNAPPSSREALYILQSRWSWPWYLLVCELIQRSAASDRYILQINPIMEVGQAAVAVQQPTSRW
jgi:hypothetical protein